jgi:hypothetical protein
LIQNTERSDKDVFCAIDLHKDNGQDFGLHELNILQSLRAQLSATSVSQVHWGKREAIDNGQSHIDDEQFHSHHGESHNSHPSIPCQYHETVRLRQRLLEAEYVRCSKTL